MRTVMARAATDFSSRSALSEKTLLWISENAACRQSPRENVPVVTWLPAPPHAFLATFLSMFELFEHTADLGLRVQAATLEELLAEAARGLLVMLVANPDAVRPLHTKTISLSAGQPTYLLFDWLSELLYIFEAEKLLLAEFKITCTRGDELAVEAVCRGEPMDETRHHMDHEVKAITYHGLKVEQSLVGWSAEVIVDI